MPARKLSHSLAGFPQPPRVYLPNFPRASRGLQRELQQQELRHTLLLVPELLGRKEPQIYHWPVPTHPFRPIQADSQGSSAVLHVIVGTALGLQGLFRGSDSRHPSQSPTGAGGALAPRRPGHRKDTHLSRERASNFVASRETGDARVRAVRSSARWGPEADP